MKGKAGILTFHCVPNYGAALQAYALQEKLKIYFEEVEIINYFPNSITEEYKTINCYSIFSFASTIWSAHTFNQKINKFKDFENKYLSVSSFGGKTSKALEKFDGEYLFLGSDQIWNSQITNGLDPVYFGDFSCENAHKVISYAASIGKNNLTQEEQMQMKRLLEKVDNISVREKEAKEVLDKKLGIKSTVVADPTILVGASCFRPLIHSTYNKPFVLSYTLNGYAETDALAEKVSKYMGLKLIELSGRRKPFISKKHETIYNASPEEFLSLINDAEFVVTDSFHGTVFSLLFHKNFLTLPHSSRGGRISNLMEITGTQERLTSVFERSIVKKELDWNNIDKRLLEFRKESDKFILSAIGE